MKTSSAGLWRRLLWAGFGLGLVLGTPTPASGASDGDVGAVTGDPASVASLWEKMQGLDAEDRANASIEVEAGDGVVEVGAGAFENVEQLWNTGRYDEAIQAIRSLEASGVGFAIGLSWNEPKEVDLPEWPGNDVRIGTRSNIVETHLDFDAQNGNLFTVLRYEVSASLWDWSVNISTDGGQTWQETYTWSAGYEIRDVSAVVVHDFLYVGYVGSATFDEARIRRCFVSDGSIDAVFSNQTVFDNGVAIEEIALASNADEGLDNRVYYAAIQSNNELIFYFGSDIDTLTPTWNVWLTGVTNAASGLDVTWNQDPGPSGYALFMSYIASDGVRPVMVLRTEGSIWDPLLVTNLTGTDDRTSISAFQDTVIVAYQQDFANGKGIRYNVSYNGGDGWSVGSWEPEPGQNYHGADVTCRGGHGSAIVFSSEAGEFDPVWVYYRDHYGSGPWDAMGAQVNDLDAATAYPNRIEWIPQMVGEPYAYGVIYISFDPASGVPFFDRVPMIFADGFDWGNTGVWSAP